MDLEQSENPVSTMCHEEASDQGNQHEETAPLLARLEQLEAKVDNSLVQAQSSTESTINSILGRVGATPCNWHQAVCFFLATRHPQDDDLRRKAPLMYAAAFGMVAFQLLTTTAIAVSTVSTSCTRSHQCSASGFCVERGMCMSCGWHSPFYKKYPLMPCSFETDDVSGRDGEVDAMCIPEQNFTEVSTMCQHPEAFVDTVASQLWYGPDRGETRTRDGLPHEHPERTVMRDLITPTFIRSFCEACVHLEDNRIDVSTPTDRMYENIMAMRIGDSVALAFSAYIVALTVVAEMQDVLLCLLSISGKKEQLGTWRWALWVCAFLRCSLIIPFMLSGVAMLVLMRGGDALSVAFNTIALIFLLDVDNLSYSYGLSERQQMRMETDGRVALTDADKGHVALIKAVQVPVIMCGICVTVWRRRLFPAMFAGAQIMGIANSIAVLLCDLSVVDKAKALSAVALSYCAFYPYFLWMFSLYLMGEQV